MASPSRAPLAPRQPEAPPHRTTLKNRPKVYGKKTGKAPRATFTPESPEKALGDLQKSIRNLCLEFSPADHRILLSDAKKRVNNTVRSRADQIKSTKRTLHLSVVSDPRTEVYVRPILDEADPPCIQRLDNWRRAFEHKFTIEKIAEGSYGEVYMLRNKKNTENPLRQHSDPGAVFKFIPVRAQAGAGSRKFTSVAEIATEVQLLKRLDPIPGFARFRGVHVLQGRFPESLQKAWERFRKSNSDCFTPDPSKATSYPNGQLWVVIEMDDAGVELEKFEWHSAFQIWDIFWGVALAIGKAETEAKFEHRDLHLGNICVQSRGSDRGMEGPNGNIDRKGESISGFGLSGIKTTIIDYTLSRAELESKVAEGNSLIQTAYNDIDKKKIFDAVGTDKNEKLLRETYRFMRAQIYKGEALDPDQAPNCPKRWAEYHPKTNLIWLGFLLENLLDRNLEQEEYTGPRQHLHDKLWKQLLKIRKVLMLEGGVGSLSCVGDLVSLAVDSGWLTAEDVLG